MAKIDLRKLIKEEVRKIMTEMPEGYVGERKLTPAEEKKKEELVKALKPKYGKTPKTYAIATAQAKKMAEELEEISEDLEMDSDFERVEPINKYSSKIIDPRNGINSSNKYLAIVFKNNEVDDNKYFDDEGEAKKWCDDCCAAGQSMDERMLAFPSKTKAPGRNKENLPYHSPVSKTLDEMEMEEEAEFTDKYDDNPELKGKQSKLPDHLQKAIINKKDSKKENLEEDILSFSNITLQPRDRVKHLPYHASEKVTKK